MIIFYMQHALISLYIYIYSPSLISFSYVHSLEANKTNMQLILIQHKTTVISPEEFQEKSVDTEDSFLLSPLNSRFMQHLCHSRPCELAVTIEATSYQNKCIVAAVQIIKSTSSDRDDLRIKKKCAGINIIRIGHSVYLENPPSDITMVTYSWSRIPGG